jgi:hypothetical protein
MNSRKTGKDWRLQIPLHEYCEHLHTYNLNKFRDRPDNMVIDVANLTTTQQIGNRGNPTLKNTKNKNKT